METPGIEQGFGLSYTRGALILSALFGVLSLMFSLTLFAGLGGFGKNKFIVDERVCICYILAI